jgi:aromatic ring-opening dioxygenase LigB subunit
MAIVAAAVVPHSPLLLPSIAKNHYERSAQTRAALLEVGQELYAAQPDAIVFITPHGAAIDGGIVIEQDDILRGHLRDFGDLKTTLEVPGAVQLAHLLKEAAEDTDLPVVLQSRTGLDYGVTVPWLTLWPATLPSKGLVIAVNPSPTDQLVRFGQTLRNFFQSRPERVIVIASGDAERRSPGSSDADRRPTARERAISDAISHLDMTRLPELPLPGLCLAEPVLTLLSSLQGLSGRGTIRSFEVPLTVGQLVASITLS